MKTRLDFVSNSSSSSYIIAAEDNVHLMVLSDPEVMTLKELLKRFGHRMFFPYWRTSAEELRMAVVPDDKFISMFLFDTLCKLSSNERIYCIPECASRAFELYLKLDDIKTEEQYIELISTVFKPEAGNLTTELDDLVWKLRAEAQNAVVDACYKVLKTELDKMLFCYQEIEDSYRGAEVFEDPFKLSVDPDSKRHSYDVEDVMRSRVNKTFYEDCSLAQANDECLVAARIAFLEKLRGPFKFKRVFSNH